MIPYLLVFLLGLVVFLVKTIINLYSLLSMIRKDKAVLSQVNHKEHTYEFVKGLH